MIARVEYRYNIGSAVKFASNTDAPMNGNFDSRATLITQYFTVHRYLNSWNNG